MTTRITRLLGIRHPIIQAGMSWASSCSALPAAVSKAGGLGVIAAGPLLPPEVRATIRAVRASLDGEPFALNVPLTRPQADQILDIAYDERVPVVIGSQGGARGRTGRFAAIGTPWLHVVASVEHARKAAAAGADALIVVGVEAGGHPPASEVSTLVLVRRIVQEAPVPVVAGGGVADGYGIAALLALGADAVQLGTRFLLTEEANVHQAYKDRVRTAEVDETALVGRRGRPIRGIRNRFAAAVAEAETTNLPAPEYEMLLATSSLRLAALEGDVEWGKVEAGQSAGLIHDLLPAGEVMARLVAELEEARRRLAGL